MIRTRITAAAASIALVVLSACGGDSSTSTTSTPSSTTTSGASTTVGAAAKPQVKIPASTPTELVITDLVEGTGRAAEPGDEVSVHYVGVRSADGTEFDNSYDRGQPFPVTLGQGMVIKGWDQGLIGVKAGGRRQLDIPAALAYGDNPQGDVIKPGDALSFVVDVVSVAPGLPATVAENEPEVTIAGQANVAELGVNDLVVGTGREVATGDKVAVHVKAYRADTGQEINSTWQNPTAVSLTADPTVVLPGLANGLVGMKEGGRRQLTVPFAQGFGEAGNPQLGLPAKTDLILVVDLISIR